MEAKYVSRAPKQAKRSQCYKEGRLPQSERSGELPGYGKLQHSTTPDITPRHVVAKNLAAQKERMEKMFANMKAVENVPVASRGRAGVDLTQTDEFKALASMPVTHKDDKTGWFAVECGSDDKAKKQQAMVNRYARAGAGTFRTRLLKGSSTLYIKRIAEEYVQQRGGGDAE